MSKEIESNALAKFTELYNIVIDKYEKLSAQQSNVDHVTCGLGYGSMVNLLQMIASLNNRLDRIEKELTESDDGRQIKKDI